MPATAAGAAGVCDWGCGVSKDFGFHRGHVIYYDGIKWRYRDTAEPVPDNPYRQCGKCDKPNTPEGHDPCLGTLPGVMNACCGHGHDDEAYVQHIDGTVIRGALALLFQSDHA